MHLPPGYEDAHSSPRLGDLDGDGNLDIICLDAPHEELVQYRNQSTLAPVTVLSPTDKRGGEMRCKESETPQKSALWGKN